MSRRRTEAGFTLVEVLVVLAILSLTLAISLPYSSRFGEARKLELAAATLAAELRNAEAQALARGRDQRITIALSRDVVMLSSRDQPLVLPPETTVSIRSASDHALDKNALFVFFADGGSTGGKILLERGGRRAEVAVNWLTGAIIVSEDVGQ